MKTALALLLVQETLKEFNAFVIRMRKATRKMEYAFQAIGEYTESKVASALKQRDYKDATDLIVRSGYELAEQTAYGYDSYNQTLTEEKAHTLKSQQGGDDTPRVSTSIVRRLTPLECERLQGMPDDWSKYGINEKGEVYELADSARYRLQGNGIATPFWRWMMKRISAQYERTPTLGSLFDGQGSFPMIWEGINGKGTALWSSEIDKNAVAVAKFHFPEDGEQ